jgi:hypothetical protein
MKTILIIFSILILSACQKPAPILPEYNAEIISLDKCKVYCKYGYLIIYNNDTILSDSPILFDEIGMIDKPVDVWIDAKLLDDWCKYPYYEVTRIETYHINYENSGK